jgi:hypothetical protein
MVGAVGAVDPNGAAEFGDRDDDRVPPGVVEVGLERVEGGVEPLQPLGQQALRPALVLMGVETVEGQRRDPRPLRCRKQAGGELGFSFRPLPAYFPGDASGTDRILVVERKDHRRVSLRRPQQHGELAQHIRADRLALERPGGDAQLRAFGDRHPEMVLPEGDEPLD